MGPGLRASEGRKFVDALMPTPSAIYCANDGSIYSAVGREGPCKD